MRRFRQDDKHAGRREAGVLLCAKGKKKEADEWADRPGGRFSTSHFLPDKLLLWNKLINIQDFDKGFFQSRAVYCATLRRGKMVISSTTARSGSWATISAAAATSSGLSAAARFSAETGLGLWSRMGVSTSPG